MVTGSSLAIVALCAVSPMACSSGTPGAAQAKSGAVADGGGTEAGKPSLPCTADESAPVPADRCTSDPSDKTRPACGTWVKVEPPGAVCSDGSQFKFFVNYSDKSNNLVVDFEPGGACWDYESCSGRVGVRGAANPHGIPDDHMSNYQYLGHLRRTADNPIQDYNMVFVSYCTGDVHSGDQVTTYTSAGPVAGGTGDGGTDQIVFRHNGHKNVMAVIDWLHGTFATVPRLLVTGCSAGGVGALLNYVFIRQGMGNAVQCGYLLDDSGPLFHSDGPSRQLQQTIQAAWNFDSILDGLDGQLPFAIADIKNDIGLLNPALARKYPRDRLSLAAYRMDLNYSLYSYQRFFPGSTEADIHALWWQDLQELMQTFAAEPNLAYYVPYFRTDNCSHCVSIPPVGNPPLEPTDVAKALAQPWLGSEIQQDMIDLKQFTIDLVDDAKPLKSYLEDVRPNASFTREESAFCMLNSEI
jgi:hypothetical protein